MKVRFSLSQSSKAEVMYVAASGVLRTPEAVFDMLLRNGKGDINDAAFRQRLVDTFIAKIEVRNGEAWIFYNIRENGPHSKVRVRSECGTFKNE